MSAFIYDNVTLLEGTLTDGIVVVNGGTNFVAGANLTNEERATDQSIGSAVSAWAQDDALRIDLGSSPGTPDRFAVLFNAAETDDLKVYAGAHATDLTVSTEKLNLTAAHTADTWTVSAFDSSPGDVRYYFVWGTTAGGLVGLVELIIGKIYTFDTEPDIEGFVFDMIANADLQSSYSREYEFAIKRGDLRRHWKWNWSNIGETMKDNLISFRDDVELNYKKFLYYDDSSYYWVRMTADSLKFNRKAYQIYDTTMEMVEQLR